MAYLAFADSAGNALPLPFDGAAPAPGRQQPRPGFSGLEWSVVALAERDSISSLQEPGRIATALGTIFGDYRNSRLADPKLEALRRLAVLTWHYSYRVPESAIRAFLKAGFSTDQYELLAASISSARSKRNVRTPR